MPLEEKGSLCSLEVSHPSTSPVPPFTPFLSDLAIQECRDLLPGPPSVTKCEPRPEQVPVLGSILREGHFLWSLLFLPKGWHATNTSSFPHALSPMVTEDLDLGGQLAPKNVMTRQGCSTKRPRTWRQLGAGYRVGIAGGVQAHAGPLGWSSWATDRGRLFRPGGPLTHPSEYPPKPL